MFCTEKVFLKLVRNAA